MRLFAAEPMVVNPVAMTWDERGRLWVVELYEYPMGAPDGQQPRDRIKIIEDTDADGKADKVHVWADGLNLATGILLGNGGAYVGQAPDLLFLSDTNGDDRADHSEVLLTGFGLEDRHELLNSFTWGPDNHFYMTHGVFTFSRVQDPNNPATPSVEMNAAVARYDIQTKRFEVFADGTSNPWGVDFDAHGNAFVSACVIDHLWHMAPGGQYLRQGGVWANPYAYADMHSRQGGLPTIADHRHYMAAYAGVQVYLGNQYPEEYRGTIMMGNIHANAVHQDVLTPNGASFKASEKQDFVKANDGWFMPVSEQTGPDGCLWIMDWYDKYPCYQNANADPGGVDREHGRIWRVVYTGAEKDKPVPSRPKIGMNLATAPNEELVKLLSHPNSWQQRTARRLLVERKAIDIAPTLNDLIHRGDRTDSRLAGLWTLHGLGALTDSGLQKLAADPAPDIRKWTARLLGERKQQTPTALATLLQLASDPEPAVRVEVATAVRQFTSGSLTVNTPPPSPPNTSELGRILGTLVLASKDAPDPLIPFMVWTAAEPMVAADPSGALTWLSEYGTRSLPLSAQLTTKVARRISDLRDPEAMEHVMLFLDSNPSLVLSALDGLLEAQEGSNFRPKPERGEILERLLTSNNAAVSERAERLATLWGNPIAIQHSLNLITNASAPLQRQLNAIETVAELDSPDAAEALLAATGSDHPEIVVLAAIRALGEMGANAFPQDILGRWTELSPSVRRATAETLASRDAWADALVSALERKDIQAGDVAPTAIRTLTRSKAANGMLARRAAEVFGRVRDADADKARIIAAKKRMILSNPARPDLEAGHKLASKNCLTCHRLYNEGADVGPELTGVGRSSLDGLLANIIDPNQIIGAGYENVEVETTDGQSLSGRMVENSDNRVRLLSVGPKEEVIDRQDIDSIRISELSVMPEGLEQMPDADFRNLVAFILNPPEDNQPFSWKNETSNARAQSSPPQNKASGQKIDRESVALWNPQWQLDVPDFEGTPRKYPEFAGRRNVLQTHPYSESKTATISRDVAIPPAGTTTLRLSVASHERGDWELRILANGQLLKKETVNRNSPDQNPWKDITADLTPFAGQTIQLQLENAANGWSWEFGYWQDITIQSTTSTVLDNQGFQSLFDGKSLTGWSSPDMSYWSVEENAITAQSTPEHPCTANQFLVWQGAEVSDFELTTRFRLANNKGNSGIQFRSKVTPTGDTIGYQADILPGGGWLGALCDENTPRETMMAPNGHKTVIDELGKRTTTTLGSTAELRPPGEWNDYRILAHGHHLILMVNGSKCAEVIDHETGRAHLSGILALQLRSGEPMKVQFKDIRLKTLPPSDR
jgi:putative membrane-bound dehydrogenase-like protein